MKGLTLELVIDSAQPNQHRLAQRLQQALLAGEQLRVVPWQQWLPSPCRNPGSSGGAAVCVVLPASCWRTAQAAPSSWPKGVLVLAELVGGSAVEIGAATGLTAPLQGESFSRFVLGQPHAGAGSQELEVLVQLVLPSLARWQPHQQRCLQAAADYLLWWLRLCEQRQSLLTINPLTQGVLLRPAAKLHRRQCLLANGRWALGSAKRHLRQGDKQSWQIAIGKLEPGGERLRLLHQLPPSGQDWFADPFLIVENGNTWLFCERWDEAKGKGVIELFALSEGGLEACGTVITEPFHLSFPRVVQHNGAWFATVESGSNNEVRLYRAEAFPYCWRLQRQLLGGQAWIDPILIPTAAGWWLLVNSHSSRALPGATAAELHLFHSPDLLAGQFKPHPRSPLLVDSSCGRNGGLLVLAGELVRVGQRTGINNAYGEMVQLQRLQHLDALHYSESTIEPVWLRQLPQQLNCSHLHTLNNAGPWVALDYCPKRS